MKIEKSLVFVIGIGLSLVMIYHYTGLEQIGVWEFEIRW